MNNSKPARSRKGSGPTRIQARQAAALPVRAALATRVSTLAQVDFGTSLASQDRRCRAFIESKGWTLDEQHVYADEGISGQTVAGRPGWSAMLQAAQRNEFDALVMFKVDRTGRDAREIINSVLDLNALGVEFTTVDERTDLSTARGRRDFVNDAADAQYDREKITGRFQTGHEELLDRGEPPSGRLPAGWRWSLRDPVTGKHDPKNRFEPDESMRELVRHAVDVLLAGGSLQDIVDEYNGRQVPTLSGVGRWHVDTLRRYLRQPLLHTGIWPHSGSDVKLRNPILDEPTWDRLQAKLGATRDRRRPGDKHVHLLTGRMVSPCNPEPPAELLRLSMPPDELATLLDPADRLARLSIPPAELAAELAAGRGDRKLRTYIGVMTRGRRGQLAHAIYRCNGKDRRRSDRPCDCPSIRAEYVDDRVWDAVVGVLSDPQFAQQRQAELQAEPVVDLAPLAAEVEQFEDALARAHERELLSPSPALQRARESLEAKHREVAGRLAAERERQAARAADLSDLGELAADARNRALLAGRDPAQRHNLLVDLHVWITLEGVEPRKPPAALLISGQLVRSRRPDQPGHSLWYREVDVSDVMRDSGATSHARQRAR